MDRPDDGQVWLDGQEHHRASAAAGGATCAGTGSASSCPSPATTCWIAWMPAATWPGRPASAGPPAVATADERDRAAPRRRPGRPDGASGVRQLSGRRAATPGPGLRHRRRPAAGGGRRAHGLAGPGQRRSGGRRAAGGRRPRRHAGGGRSRPAGDRGRRPRRRAGPRTTGLMTRRPTLEPPAERRRARPGRGQALGCRQRAGAAHVRGRRGRGRHGPGPVGQREEHAPRPPRRLVRAGRRHASSGSGAWGPTEAPGGGGTGPPSSRRC